MTQRLFAEYSFREVPGFGKGIPVVRNVDTTG